MPVDERPQHREQHVFGLNLQKLRSVESRRKQPRPPPAPTFLAGHCGQVLYRQRLRAHLSLQGFGRFDSEHRECGERFELAFRHALRARDRDCVPELVLPHPPFRVPHRKLYSFPEDGGPFRSFARSAVALRRVVECGDGA